MSRHGHGRVVSWQDKTIQEGSSAWGCRQEERAAGRAAQKQDEQSAWNRYFTWQRGI